MRIKFSLVAGALALVSMLAVQHSETRAAAPSKATATGSLLGKAQKGNPELTSISRISFAPQGVMLVADARAASVVAIDTGDVKPGAKLSKSVEDIGAAVAASLGTKNAKIVDLAVNPASGRIYLAVLRGSEPVILTVDSSGGLAVFDLDKATYARVTIPGGEESKVTNITDIQYAGDRVLAAGQCNEEFASKIYSLPLPLVHESSADIYSAETYHVAHRRWETRAPIRSFVPFEDKQDGQEYVVGSFSCTPIAKFPLDNLESGAKVKGISIVELGSGNQPLDMFTYTKDGKQWLVTNTYRFHFRKNLFGPSKWWGVRVNMDYLSADKINEEATRRNVKETSGPDGIEIVDALFGAVQVAKLNDSEIVVLRDKNDDGKLTLEVAPLP